MKKWQCRDCSSIFKTEDGVLIAVCPGCDSKNTKKVSLTPSKSYIHVFHLFESKKCRACGRELKSERSIKLGFGPSCGIYYAGKYLEKHPKELGERAKKRWTPEEIKALVDFASARKVG